MDDAQKMDSSGTKPIGNDNKPVQPTSSVEEMHIVAPDNSSSPTTVVSNTTMFTTPEMTTNKEETDESPKSKRGVKLALVIILLLVLVGGGIGSVAAAAYGVLPISQEAQRSLQKVLFAIPFIPKTKEYVLFASSQAHEDVTSAYIDASMAFKLVGFDPSMTNLFFGTGLINDTIELSVSGSFDALDPQNPKSSININLANQFQADAKTLDNKIYFQITKLPTFLSTYFSFTGGNTNFDPLLHKWVILDTTELDSSAKSVLEEHEDNTEKDIFDKELEKAVEKLVSDEILPAIEMTSETVSGEKMYKFRLEVSDSIIDSFAEEIEKAEGSFNVLGYSTVSNEYLMATNKPSDYLEDVTVDFWIDKKTYYMRKINFFARFKDNSPQRKDIINPTTTGDEVIEMAFSIDLSQIGETFDITPPSEYITIEEYAAQIGNYVNTLQTTPQAPQAFPY